MLWELGAGLHGGLREYVLVTRVLVTRMGRCGEERRHVEAQLAVLAKLRTVL